MTFEQRGGELAAGPAHRARGDLAAVRVGEAEIGGGRDTRMG
ncbi:hypothetical protein [Nocardia coffeae]|nr:hypothetical protein [Nocardia coffeae]